MNKYKEIKIKDTNEKLNFIINKSTWKMLIVKTKIFEIDELEVVKKWYVEPNHLASIDEIIKKYNLSQESELFDKTIVCLGKKIIEEENIDINIKDDTQTYWEIIFDLWNTEKSIWKLKSELVDAIDELKIFEDKNNLSTSIAVYNFIDKYNYWFKANQKEILEKEKNNMSLIGKFIQEFSEENIKKMQINEYVMGNDNENSFCYWIEEKFKSCGNIKKVILTKPQKYGMYFDKRINGFSFGGKFAKKNMFGNNVDIVFQKIKSEILNLISAAQSYDFDCIEKNLLNPLVKNKILFLYNNKGWIPIYSEKDLNVLLNILDIPFSMEEPRANKRKKLYEFYESLNRYDITTLRFMWFIYDNIGYRKILRGGDSLKYNDNIKIKSYRLVEINNLIEYIPRNNVNRSGLITETASTVVEKKLSGKKGEEIVKNYLLKHKQEFNIVGELDIACETNDYAHYDISYIDTSGRQIFIEVKSAKNKMNNRITFEMSSAEYNFMQEHINDYYIFFIDDVYNGNIIKKISATNIIVHPSKYKVSLIEN